MYSEKQGCAHRFSFRYKPGRKKGFKAQRRNLKALGRRFREKDSFKRPKKRSKPKDFGEKRSDGSFFNCMRKSSQKEKRSQKGCAETPLFSSGLYRRCRNLPCSAPFGVRGLGKQSAVCPLLFPDLRILSKKSEWIFSTNAPKASLRNLEELWALRGLCFRHHRCGISPTPKVFDLYAEHL